MSLAQSMNLDSVMSHLTQMSPQQLQQFAAMHKDDPIMLAAASSVKNKMDKLQQAHQAQASGQKPPPVNEQVVESMAPQGGPQASNQLPEQQGIAQLPAPNMQHMAGGGIVAFADGGYADDGYSDQQMEDGSNPVTRMADGGVARFQVGGVMGDLPGAYVPRAPAPSQYVADDSEMTMYERAKRALIQSNQEAEARRQGYKSLAEKEAVLGTNKNARDMLLERPQTPSVGAPSIDPAAAALAAKTGAGNPGAGKDVTGATQQRSPAPTGGIATIPTQDYRKQMDSFMPKDIVDPFAEQRTGLSDARTKAAQENRDLLKADIAAEGIAGKAQEERLGKREGELGKQKDLNVHMSLIEAGLATMQSRGKGLAGIAEGAGIGMKSYTSGIQRLQAAQEKIDDSRDRLDELRRNENRMNNREVRAAEKDIRGTVVSAQEDALKGAEQAYGIHKQDARTFFTAARTAEEAERDRTSRERIAKLQASVTPAQMQIIDKLGGGDFLKGYEIYKQETMLPVMQANYDKMSMDTVNGAAFLAKYPTFEVYKQSVNGPAKGGILDVPKADAAGAVRGR